MRPIQYKYLISSIVGGCLISYGAVLFINGDKANARAFIIWGILSIALSLLLKKLITKKTKSLFTVHCLPFTIYRSPLAHYSLLPAP